MPEFKERDEIRVRAKSEELEPYVEAAFERIGGRKVTHVPDDEIADITAVNYIAKYSKEETAPVLGSIQKVASG